MDNLTSVFPYTIGNIPFFYSNLDAPSNDAGLPDTLPFIIDMDVTTGTLIQKYDTLVAEALSQAYRKGSVINGCMDDTVIGRQYAQGFLKFLQKEVKDSNFIGKRVLEIGCGTGYFLHLLKQLGADVVGIEPGRQAEMGMKRYKIPIVKDFYPSKSIQNKFDIIIVSSVLEHIYNLQSWLQSLSNNLKIDGQIFIAVPDCEPYINSGDISMFIHEHWNYFTSETLFYSLSKATNFTVNIEKAKFGTQLFGVLEQQSNINKTPNLPLNKIIAQNSYLKRRIEENAENFCAILNENKMHSIGVYVPVRAMNLLAILKDRIDFKRIRFFDDDPLLYGKFFPGINIKIESRMDLVESPVDRLIIMSKTFGDKIEADLKKMTHKSIAIYNFFSEGS